MTFVNISDLAPLVVIVKLHMTNGILKPGTLRLDSVMVYHPSHTSTYFNRPCVCRCRRTCVNSQVHTFVICICRSTSCMYANAHVLTFVYADGQRLRELLQNGEEGTEFYGGRHGCFHGYYPQWESILPILSHTRD